MDFSEGIRVGKEISYEAKIKSASLNAFLDEKREE